MKLLYVIESAKIWFCWTVWLFAANTPATTPTPLREGEKKKSFSSFRAPSKIYASTSIYPTFVPFLVGKIT